MSSASGCKSVAVSHVKFALEVDPTTLTYIFTCLGDVIVEQILPGVQLLSGDIKVGKPKVNLYGIYTSSRIAVITWCILFTSFIISEGNGFDFRGALLAWVRI